MYEGELVTVLFGLATGSRAGGRPGPPTRTGWSHWRATS